MIQAMMQTTLRTMLGCFLALVFGGGPAQSRVPYTWQNVAVGGGGYVTDVYCHPKAKDRVYLRTDVGGFYRWEPNAARWLPLTDGFTRDQKNFYGGEALALDPRDSDTVYIAAGEYSADWSVPGAIFKSRDAGRHWTKLPLDLKMGGNEDHRAGGSRLAVSPADSQTLLFGSRRDGLWRSADAGASWAKVAGFPGALKDGIGITALAFGAPGVAYAAAFGDGVYESGDAGLTWRRTAGGPAEIERLATGRDGTLYATHAHGIGKLAGGKWTDITPLGVSLAFNGVSVNPRDPRDLLAAAAYDRLRLFRSGDGGGSWAEIKTETRSTVPWYADGMKQIQYTASVAFDPNVPGRVWLTDWYAVYRTENINASLNAAPVVLTNHERGHEEVVVFTLACPPGGPPLLSGVADVDGFAHADLDAFPAHGFGDYFHGTGPTYGYTEGLAWCAAQPARVARAGVVPWNKTGGVALSSDGGRTWRAAAGWDPKIYAARVAVSATDPDTLVVLRVGPGPALRTGDGGASWQAVRGLPDNLIPGVWNWQTPLTADGAAPNVFSVFAGGQVYRSADGGASFAVSASGLPGSGTSLTGVPGAAGRLWLAAGDGGLWRSGDGGRTFRALPAVKTALLFAAGKSAPGTSAAALYVYGALTDGRRGIFRSVTDGASWDEIGDPAIPIGDDPNVMAASGDTFGLVFVGTNGRGIYYGIPKSVQEKQRRRSIPGD